MHAVPVQDTGIAAPEGTGKAKAMGQEEFMRLLVTQLENQDPLNPVKDTEFLAQLAQFSALEQLVGVNQRLDDLLEWQRAAGLAGAVSLIGREVRFAGDRVTLAREGDTVTLAYELSGDAAQVQVEIFDRFGRKVRTLSPGAQEAGPQRVLWDGRDDQGQPLPAGTYTFSVSAQDVSGGRVEATTWGSGTVSSVLYEDGTPYLLVGEQRVPVWDILAVS